jgi:D-serine dehydratase
VQAFLAGEDIDDLRAGDHDGFHATGDMLAFDISHPCLTFDKWRQVLLVDEAYQVTGAVQTLF